MAMMNEAWLLRWWRSAR